MFTSEMVVAILAGRKQQTRRIIPDRLLKDLRRPASESIKTLAQWCLYGRNEDRLWVKEAFAVDYEHGENTRGHISPAVYYRATDIDTPWTRPPWKSPRFMPRRYSRITLEICAVFVQQVQEITDADAREEGIIANPQDGRFGCALGLKDVEPARHIMPSARLSFEDLWNTINAHPGKTWEENPWVWAIHFRRVE